MSRAVADRTFNATEHKGEACPDYPRIAEWYCHAVCDERIPTTELEVLACRRYLHMLQEAKKPRSEFVFSPEHALDACAFMEELPVVKGGEGDDPRIILAPVQMWWICAIFGFRERATGLRWVRTVDLWIPRKNGKSTIATGVVFYALNFEGERGADGYISAGSEKQADIPYEVMRGVVDVDAELKAHLRIDYTLQRMDFGATGAKIEILTSRAKNQDGLNPHVVLAEELHAQNDGQIGVLKTAMGSRKSPLFISISTAGREALGGGFTTYRDDERLLRGEVKSPRRFTVIYAAEKEDEDHLFESRVLEKFNPLWGVSLNPVSMEEEIAQARISETKLIEYRRTRANMWNRAAGALFSTDQWNRCGDKRLDLAVLKGFPIYVGVDLASHTDLCAACFVTRVDDCLYLHFRYWLPEQSPRFKDERYAEMFAKWVRDGHLTLTKGSHVDHEKILGDILQTIEGHIVVGFACDDWQADYMMGQTEKRGYPTFRVRKSARDLTRATDDLVARHRDAKRLQHDDNPVSAWCAGNVVGFYDHNDNVLPRKEEKGSKQSIDGMDAAILANAARLHDEAGILDAAKTEPENPYLHRGLLGAA